MKIRKTIKVLNISLLSLLIFCLFGTNISFLQTHEALNEVQLSLNVGNGNLIYYNVDNEGNVSGIEDFTIDEQAIYLLDSTENKVIKSNNGIISTIKLDKKAMKITSGYSKLYTLNNDLTISKYDKDGQVSNFQLDGNMSEAIVDFKWVGEFLYITTPEGNCGHTYKLALNDNGVMVAIDSFQGRIFDEKTIYRTELKTYMGKSVGKRGKLKVIDMNTGMERVIPLSSKYWLIGAEYLGEDTQGNQRMKLFEMSSKPGYAFDVEETIQVFNQNGTRVGIYGKEKQVKSISNQVKVFGGEIYELKNLENKVEIIKLASPGEKSLQSFNSKLADIVELNEEIESSDFQSTASITRSTIMNNAKSYHSSFNWSCSSANLATLTNWTKPRYVGSEGEYSCMPYCWGGFSSPSQYTTGLSGGGRVGNINTSISGYVNNTFGVDCSGFVSRAWGLSTKYGTSSIMNVASKINASSLLQGDALNKSGSHIVLFEKYDTSGNYVLYESTKLNSYDRVSNTVRSVSSISNYVPIRYNNVVNQ